MGTSVEEGTFQGFDGTDLFFQTWPKNNPRAIVLGVHGLGEYSDTYKRLAQGLEGSPFQLIMSDHRGHGRSSGARGVGSIDEFVLDLRLFVTEVRQKFVDLPFFFLGHSMGGLVLTKLLIRNGAMGARGAVLSSPLLGVAVEIPAIKEKSAGLLNFLLPNIGLHNEIPNENLTHDKDVIREYEQDNHRHNKISPKLFVSMLESIKYVFEQRDKLSLPLLLQQSGEDKVVNQKKSEEFFDSLEIKDKEKIIYEGFFHEIYNETQRARPFADLKKWLEKHL